MPRERKKYLLVAGLNLVANPHPPGTYWKLIQSLSDREVPAFGDEKAILVNVRQRHVSREKSIAHGHIFFFTEIVRGGEWLDLIAKKPVAGDTIEIPENMRPNLKASQFVFELDTHRLYYERRNEKGEQFAPRKVVKVFENLLALASVVEEFPDTAVTVLPKQDAIEKVLRIPQLKRLEIRLERPNSDDIASETRRLMKKLEAMHASRQHVIITKAKGAETLSPDKETVTLAEVAAENGYVRGEGTDRNGVAVVRRTTDYPVQHRLPLDDGQSPLSRLFEFLRLDIDV